MAAAAPPPGAPSPAVADRDSDGIPDVNDRLPDEETVVAGNAFGAPAPAKPVKAPTTAPAAGDSPTTNPTPPPRRESLLIYNAPLVLAVFQVDASLGKIEELARSMGGYLAARHDASITVRIPRARFQELLAGVVKLGDVLHRNVEAIDVSDQVVDLEARLKNARAVRDRLAQLLQGATATKDALEIEKELARVMGEIEAMEGKLKLYADKIAYSTVTVSFEPLHTSEVHAMARLPFRWLDELGLAALLQVKQ